MNPNMHPVIPVMCLLIGLFYMSWIFIPDDYFDERK